MISGLLPPGTCAVESFGPCSAAFLMQEEVDAIGSVSSIRLNEFTLARTCARHAIAQLGLTPVPILIGPHREPLWPSPLVGSITHCRGYCAAAVACKSTLTTIGIDAEIHSNLPIDVLEQIVVDEERTSLAALPKDDVHWDRVLFSAKECVYKAWYPLAHRWLGFKDAAISLHPEDETFSVRLLITPPQISSNPFSSLSGKYRVEDGLVVTAIWQEATDTPDRCSI